MQNVAIIISSLKGGGAERVVSNITMNLPKNKYNVYLILFDSSDMAYTYGGELIDINIKATKNPLKKVTNLVRRYFVLKNIKKEYEIDTSISFLAGPNLLNILTKNNDKVIVSLRGYASLEPKGVYGYISEYLMGKTYKSADKIVLVSKLIKEDVVKKYNFDRNRVLTVYNPYNLYSIVKDSKEDIREKYLHMFEKNTIITVGRLTDVKGHWHLIRAFNKVVQIKKNVNLIILGDGELKEYLQGLIKDLDLEENIYLLGFKTNPYKYIAKSTAFILSSLSEGFPNTLVEAMACGLPVISVDCKSGPREILAPDTNIQFQCNEKEYADYGILIPTCDGEKYNAKEPITREEDIMAESILDIICNDKLHEKYSKRSIKRSKHFSVSKIINKWEKII